MQILLAAVTTGFLIAFFINPVIIKFFKKRNLLDSPGRRKIHKEENPSMGGIAIFAGFFVAVTIWIPFEGFAEYKYVFAALSIIFITGVRDDILPLRPIYKLAGQLIAASMVVFLTDIRLTSMYGLFGINELPLVLSYGLTLFTVIVITNSFNLIDGLDGLAGSIALIVLISLGSWFFLTGATTLAIASFCLAGAVIGFLNFNWQPAKIFMGDTGALLLGFFFSLLAIKFIDANSGLESGSPFKFTATVSTAVCILIVPLFDTLRIIIIRLVKRQSPFRPDRNHTHHVLMRLGFSHAQTAMALAFANLLFIGLAFLGKNESDMLLLPIIVGICVMASLTLDFLIIKRVTTKNGKKKMSSMMFKPPRQIL